MIPPFVKGLDKLIHVVIVIVVLIAVAFGILGFVVGRLTAPTTKVIEKITDTK